MSVVRIGPYTLPNRVILAPMAGVTDRPFRQLCRRLGAGLVVAEMLTSDVRLWHRQIQHHVNLWVCEQRCHITRMRDAMFGRQRVGALRCDVRAGYEFDGRQHVQLLCIHLGDDAAADQTHLRHARPWAKPLRVRNS